MLREIKRLAAVLLCTVACVLAAPVLAQASTSPTDASKPIKVEFSDSTPSVYADRFSDLVGAGTNIIGGDTTAVRTITLQKDVSLSDGITIYGDVTLDLNGKTITAQSDAAPQQKQVFVAASAGQDCNFTVKDSAGGGKIVASGFESVFKTADANAKLSISGGSFVLGNNPSSQFVVVSEKGEISITDGTFINLSGATRTDAASGPGVLLTTGTSKKVSITGGTFMSTSITATALVGTAGELVIEQASGKAVRVSGSAGAVYVEGGTIGSLAGNPALSINGGTYESGKTVVSTTSGYATIDATGVHNDIALLVSTGEGNSTNKNGSVEAVVKDGSFIGSKSVQLGSVVGSASNEDSTLRLEKGTFAGSVVIGSNFPTGTTGGLTIKVNPEVTYTKNGDIASAYASGFVLYDDGSTKLPLLDSSVTFGSSADNLVYDGAPKRPAVSVTLGSHECSEGTDYNLAYDNNVNAGENTATVTVTAAEGSNYAGTVVKRFTIKPKELITSGSNRNTVVTLAQSTVPYCELTDSSGVYYYFDPEVTVAVDTTVIDSSNYDISTSADPTSYLGTVTITGKGNYTGTASVSCSVVKGVAVTFVDGFEPADSPDKIIAIKAVFPYSPASSTSTGSTTPPTPPLHSGYAFAGWVGNYTTVTEDTTVIGRYIEDPFGAGIVVSFIDPRNNNEIIKAEAVPLGGTATPPDSASMPKYDGYSFVGWTGTYTNVSSSSTVTARYMGEGGHQVTFVDPLDGNKVIKKVVVTDGGAAAAPTEEEMPKHPGYRHVGWDKNFTKVESDLQINATYEPCETHAVTFVDTMNNNAVIKVVEVNDGEAATEPLVGELPKHDGYNFAGWEDDFSKVTEDITVRSKWEKQPDPPKPAAGDMAVLTTVTREDGSVAYRLMDENGKPASGWLLVGGKWYIADDNGYARTGLYHVGPTTYVLNNQGVLQTGWVYLFDTNAWIYANPGTTGNYAAVIKGEWFWDGDGWYLAGPTGPIRTGWVEDEGNGLKYHLNDGSNGTFGKMDTNRWVLKDGSWYWVGGNGTIASGWQWIDGDWYYLNPEEGGNYGKLMTGWFWDGFHWYWTNYSGKMLRNTWVFSNGAWYYMGIDGAMRTGWSWIDGGWYYFDANGVMYAQRMTPDGCLVGPDGRWI